MMLTTILYSYILSFGYNQVLLGFICADHINSWLVSTEASNFVKDVRKCLALMNHAHKVTMVFLSCAS